MPRTPFREGAGHYDAQVEVEENSFTLRLSLRFCPVQEVLLSLNGTAQ